MDEGEDVSAPTTITHADKPAAVEEDHKCWKCGGDAGEPFDCALCRKRFCHFCDGGSIDRLGDMGDGDAAFCVRCFPMIETMRAELWPQSRGRIVDSNEVDTSKESDDEECESLEVERKFAPPGYYTGLGEPTESEEFFQSYIALDGETEVRVRWRQSVSNTRRAGSGTLTVKTKIPFGGELVREEVEVPLSYGQFRILSASDRGRRVHKTRETFDHCPLAGGRTLELDTFHSGRMKDKLLAEIEFDNPDEAAAFDATALGPEVTDDKAYKNRNIADPDWEP